MFRLFAEITMIHVSLIVHWLKCLLQELPVKPWVSLHAVSLTEEGDSFRKFADITMIDISVIVHWLKCLLQELPVKPWVSLHAVSLTEEVGTFRKFAEITMTHISLIVHRLKCFFKELPDEPWVYVPFSLNTRRNLVTLFLSKNILKLVNFHELCSNMPPSTVRQIFLGRLQWNII